MRFLTTLTVLAFCLPVYAGGEKVPLTGKSLKFSTIPSKTLGLELTPAEITVPSSKKFTLVIAKCEGEVRWFVTNTAKKPVEWLELPSSKTILVFPNYDLDDTINVYAYTAKDSKPSAPVRAVIKVVRKLSPLDPDPVKPKPKPPGPELPPGSQLHFTIITDNALSKTNADLAKLIASKELADTFDKRGHKLWLMEQNKDAKAIKDREFHPYLLKVGKVPMFIIQDSKGNVLEFGRLPLTAEAIIAEADKVVKPSK